MASVLTIFADASLETGYGHLYRSLLVARTYLRHPNYGCQVVLANGHNASLVVRSGFENKFADGDVVARVTQTVAPEDGPILLDTYDTAETTLHTLAEMGYRIAMFEDGCRLPFYDVDIMIDSAIGAQDLPYKGRETTRFMLGPTYFPLRDEFKCSSFVLVQNKQIIVTFGGSDPDDLTALSLDALQGIEQTNLIFILGPGYEGSVSERDARPGISICRNVENMAKVMATADIILGGGGATAFEAASLGIPLLLIILSSEQCRLSSGLATAGVAQVIGEWASVSAAQIRNAVIDLMNNDDKRAIMSDRGRALIDGIGAHRIADALAEISEPNVL